MLLQVKESVVTFHREDVNSRRRLCVPLQFEAKKRVAAEDALRHPYFRSLGEQVQTLSDSEFVTFARFDSCSRN